MITINPKRSILSKIKQGYIYIYWRRREDMILCNFINHHPYFQYKTIINIQLFNSLLYYIIVRENIAILVTTIKNVLI